jgi:hypothetical protein
MASLDLLRLARDTDELRAHIESSFAQIAAPGAPPVDRALVPAGSASNGVVAAPANGRRDDGQTDAVDIVLNVPRRVRPVPPWRPRAVAVAAQAALLLCAGTWMMSTDEVTALAGMVLRVHALKHVSTSQHNVAMIVRTPMRQIPRVSAELSGAGLRVSFAESAAPSASTLTGLRARGDEVVPEVGTAGALRWLRTRGTLRSQARTLGLRRRFYFLEPRSLSVGQLVLARTAGATPVVGAVRLDARGSMPQRPMRAGDVVVVTLDGSDSSLVGLERLVSRLGNEGLGVEPLSSLTRSGTSPVIKATSSGDRASEAAPPASSSSEATRGTPPSGVVEKLSPSSRGASITGTSV